MRWVFTTPLGVPVEPEVNSTFAIVCGPTAACAAASAAEGGLAAIAASERERAEPCDEITTMSRRPSASIAGAYRSASSTNTMPGASTSASSRSRAKLVDCSEYAGETGETGTPMCAHARASSAASMPFSDSTITGRVGSAPSSSRPVPMPTTASSAAR